MGFNMIRPNQLSVSRFKWWYAPVVYLVANCCLVALSFFSLPGEWLVSLQFIGYALISFALVWVFQSRLSSADFPFVLSQWRITIACLALAFIAFELLVYWFEHTNAAAKDSSKAVLQTMNFGQNPQRDGLLLLNICCLAPIGEELLFRGVIFRSLRDGLSGFIPLKLSLAIGVLISATLFAMSHGTPEQAAQFGILLVMGVVAALLYEYTGSLSVPILFHSLNNIFALYLDSDVLMALGVKHSLLYIMLITSFLCCLIILALLATYLPRKSD